MFLMLLELKARFPGSTVEVAICIALQKALGKAQGGQA